MMATRRVLVVDDDQVVGRSINRVLAEQGYQVREALDGHEALDEMEHQDYDLVFTDIKMPGMDGLEVASKVKKLHPGVPVVMITGYGTEANEQKARSLGVTAFLRKPLTPEMIVENAELASASGRRPWRRSAPRPSRWWPRRATGRRPPWPRSRENVARNVALFFAAPFIGLAYILAFPFIGVWAMGKYGIKAIRSGK